MPVGTVLADSVPWMHYFLGLCSPFNKVLSHMSTTRFVCLLLLFHTVVTTCIANFIRWTKSRRQRCFSYYQYKALCKLMDPHICPNGTLVHSRGTHKLSCKRGSRKLLRHAVINNLIYRTPVRARIPSIMKPIHLSRSDGKRLDGFTQLAWFAGRSII